jgi:hypothetical protein
MRDVGRSSGMLFKLSEFVLQYPKIRRIIAGYFQFFQILLEEKTNWAVLLLK